MRYRIFLKSSKNFFFAEGNEYVDKTIVVYAKDDQAARAVMMAEIKKIENSKLPLTADFEKI